MTRLKQLTESLKREFGESGDVDPEMTAQLVRGIDHTGVASLWDLDQLIGEIGADERVIRVTLRGGKKVEVPGGKLKKELKNIGQEDLDPMSFMPHRNSGNKIEVLKGLGESMPAGATSGLKSELAEADTEGAAKDAAEVMAILKRRFRHVGFKSYYSSRHGVLEFECEGGVFNSEFRAFAEALGGKLPKL